MAPAVRAEQGKREDVAGTGLGLESMVCKGEEKDSEDVGG